MGSRIIHLAIGTILNDKFEFNKEGFLLGNLLPDAHDSNDEAKAKSHFKMSRPGRLTGRYLDYDRFVDKYKSQIDDSLYMGYYCHLISDEIWLRDIFFKYIPARGEPGRQEKLGCYYRDFSRLNKLLINDYGISSFKIYKENYGIEEINYNLIDDIMSELNKDIKGRDIDDTELELLRYEEIIKYIGTTVRVLTNEIESMMPK